MTLKLFAWLMMLQTKIASWAMVSHVSVHSLMKTSQPIAQPLLFLRLSSVASDHCWPAPWARTAGNWTCDNAVGSLCSIHYMGHAPPTPDTFIYVCGAGANARSKKNDLLNYRCMMQKILCDVSPRNSSCVKRRAVPIVGAVQKNDTFHRVSDAAEWPASHRLRFAVIDRSNHRRRRMAYVGSCNPQRRRMAYAGSCTALIWHKLRKIRESHYWGRPPQFIFTKACPCAGTIVRGLTCTSIKTLISPALMPLSVVAHRDVVSASWLSLCCSTLLHPLTWSRNVSDIRAIGWI